MRLIVDNGPPDRAGPRILAPGAPPSPGPLPTELTPHLEHGEVLAWWGEKRHIELTLVGLSFGAAVLALLGVTAFAPEFWRQGLTDIAAPVGALLSPTALVLGREWVARRAVMVTDGAIVVVEPSGASTRLPLPAIRTIRRDFVRGGAVLEGAGLSVAIPAALAEPTGAALASRIRSRTGAAGSIDDRLGWLP